MSLRRLFHLGCRYALFDAFAFLSQLSGMRYVTRWRMRSHATDALVFLATAVMAGASVLFAGMGRWGLAFALLGIFTAFYFFMASRMRLLARGANVAVSFSNRCASMHLLRVRSFAEMRDLMHQAAHAVHDAVLLGVEEINAASPILCMDRNLERLQRTVINELQALNERQWSLAVGDVYTMGLIQSFFFRVAYHDTLTDEFNRECPQYFLLGLIPTRLRLVKARKLVFRRLGVPNILLSGEDDTSVKLV